ncbi:hypothetical protein RB614_07860 [Phytohabitans sp. ZYX-F-186]|uniref:Uncharacterized protein n=1 Tax=Phytohabitans maris TaxID=3071409 RepID=A0ABU0ZBM0_9ACTN|nr:hypothetical protein [Phytohabitans sp. ZYX-F-186]MDQ7904438.1 hypothetical protein [Phytohabitans sp. ZYX-F-186]
MSRRTMERLLPPVEPISPAPSLDRPEMSDATRHLCVGAYLDDHFRDRCLRDVYHQKRRFVAPSYGFDVVVVLDQCLRARDLTIFRDAGIVLAGCLAAYLNWLSIVALAATLILLRAARSAWRLIRDFVGRVRAGTAVDTTVSPGRGLVLLLGWTMLGLGLAAIAGRVVSATASPLLGGPDDGGPALSLGGSAGYLFAAVVLLVPAAYALWRQKRIEQFTLGRPAPPVRPSSRLRQIDEQRHGNTVIYSGFEPFIGSGEVMSTWGFAQRLVRKPPDNVVDRVLAPLEGEREFAQSPFSAADLVDYLRTHLGALASADVAEQRIPDMRVEDRVFLSAREWGHRTLTTSPEEMAEIIRNPTMPARHYLACQVVSWRGALVTTVHVHVALQGRSLYLEVTTTFLAPPNEWYRTVDIEGGTGPGAWMRALRSGLTATPRTIVRAPGGLIQSVARLGRASHGAARMGLSRRRYDYGTRTSVREIGTKDKLRNFTQRQDVFKFKRLIERRVIAHVLDFLDERDVDTTEYRASAASVLNIGVGHFGQGDMTFHDQVVGQRMPEPTQPAQPAE